MHSRRKKSIEKTKHRESTFERAFDRITRTIRSAPTTTMTLTIFIIANLALFLYNSGNNSNNKNHSVSAQLIGTEQSCTVENEIIDVSDSPHLKCWECVCKSKKVVCSKIKCKPVEGCYMMREKAEGDDCCPACKGCWKNGTYHKSGSTWSDTTDPCKTYTCSTGVVTESRVVCHAPCENPTPPDAHRCCPVCPTCRVGEKRVKTSIGISKDDPCVICECSNDKKLTCTKKTCPVLNCPPSKIIHSDRECCPHCLGSGVYEDPPNGGCFLGNPVYRTGQRFTLDACTDCSCNSSIVDCVRQSCPILGCKKEHQETTLGGCCPRCKSLPTTLKPQIVDDDDDEVRSRYDISERFKALLQSNDSRGDNVTTPKPKAVGDIGNNGVVYKIELPEDSKSKLKTEGLIADNEVPPKIELSKDSKSKLKSQGNIVDEVPPKIEPSEDSKSKLKTLENIADNGVSPENELSKDSKGKLETEENIIDNKVPPKIELSKHSVGKPCKSHKSNYAYKNGESWRSKSCENCECLDGEIRCKSIMCPAVSCPPGLLLKVPKGQCCPACESPSASATCTVFGGTHFRTFDAKVYSFVGSCEYFLTKDNCEDDDDDDDDDFEIRLKLTARDNDDVTIDRVSLTIGNLRVSAKKNRKIAVNDRIIDLPYKLRNKLDVRETKDEEMVLSLTRDDVKIFWNYKNFLEVTVADRYRKRPCGLCGNFNSLPDDDLTTRDGILVDDAATFAQSWSSDDDNCFDTRRYGSKSCDSKKHRRICGYLKGPAFSKCRRRLIVDSYHDACLRDMCDCDADDLQCHCESFTRYVNDCHTFGIMLPRWKSAVGC